MARKAPNLANKSGSGSSSAKARSTPAIRENLGARHRRETDELFRTRLLTAAMFGAILSPLFGVVDVLAHESWFPEMPLVGFLVLVSASPCGSSRCGSSSSPSGACRWPRWTG